MVFAVIWHYWIGVALVFGAVVAIPFTVGGYLNKVVRPKYPTREQRERLDQSQP